MGPRRTAKAYRSVLQFKRSRHTESTCIPANARTHTHTPAQQAGKSFHRRINKLQNLNIKINLYSMTVPNSGAAVPKRQIYSTMCMLRL